MFQSEIGWTLSQSYSAVLFGELIGGAPAQVRILPSIPCLPAFWVADLVSVSSSGVDTEQRIDLTPCSALQLIVCARYRTADLLTRRLL